MGKIELDHTGSGSGITLSSDGTDLLLNGTAVGGGGGSALELYDENPSTPTANTVTGSNSAAIGENLTVSGDNSLAAGTGGTATGYSSFAFGDGADATANHSVAIGGGAIQASGAQSIAIGYGSDATNSDAHAFGRNANASGSSATALGRDAVASTTRAVALGDSRANGVDSLAAAIADNSASYGATGANSIAMGYRAKGSSGKSTAIGGEQPLASGSNSFAAGGEFQTASGAYSVSLGGSVNTASGEASYAFGKRALADKVGKYAYGAQLTGTSGATQAGMMVLIADTTDATAEALRSNTNAAGTTNQVVVPSNAAFAFHGTIVAKQSGSANAAAWKVEGLIVNNGGTTTLTNSATTVISNTPSWGMALSADDTNDALKIQVTGAAATNIRWVATIHTSEVTYA